MAKFIRLATGFFLAGLSGLAYGIPALQLNIEGGFYDTTDETIVTADDVFTLDAFAWANKFSIDDDQPVYLAVAITPKQENNLPDIGSFVIDGTSYSISDLIFGTPPIENGEAIFDGGDLGQHGIFDTYFLELEFFFDAAMTVAAFNTQDDAGKIPTPATGDPKDLMYMAQFEIDTSGLLEGFELHFDLYNTHVKNSKNCTSVDDCDFDIDDFAPFSHDAGTVSVPEPHNLALLGMGLLILGSVSLKRRSAYSVQ